jgi:hypothetical protein
MHRMNDDINEDLLYISTKTGRIHSYRQMQILVEHLKIIAEEGQCIYICSYHP